MSLPISDDLFAAIQATAAPVTPSDRGQFLQELANGLQQHAIIGTGLVHRVAAELRRKHLV